MKEHYDVFISYKHLGEDGKPTRDSQLAADVFEFLSAREVRVFYSRVSLEKLGVSAYKRAIDAALDAASVLVAVGTSTENLDSQWVRYEWDSFYNDILSDVKPSGRVFSYIDTVKPSELPRALRQTQAIIHREGALNLLYNFVANAIGLKPGTLKGAPAPQEPAFEVADVAPIEAILRELDSLISALTNFHSNPEGIYYIGQTLVECESFLEDHDALEGALPLIDKLIDDIDNDERKEMGALDPIVSIGKVRLLIRHLKNLKQEYLRGERSA